MEFTHNERADFWSAETTRGGSPLRLRLIWPQYWPALSKEQLAALLLTWLDEHWGEIQGACASEFVDLYNDDWRQESQPKLTPSEFSDHLVLTAAHMQIEDPDEFGVTLYFTAAQLFGGHALTVSWDQGQFFAAMSG